MTPRDTMLSLRRHLSRSDALLRSTEFHSALSDNRSGTAKLFKDIKAKLADLVLGLDNSSSNPALDPITGSAWGPIGALNRKLAAAYNAVDARFVESGSSGSNVRLGFAVLRYLAGSKRSIVLLDRCVHQSVVGAATLANLDVRWLPRAYDGILGVQLPQTAKTVAAVLDADPRIGAVVLTSPTYDGFIADQAAIREVCAKRRVLLWIDAAWGALHGICEVAGFPPSPAALGADATVLSLHKKGIGPSQASVVLFNNELLLRAFDAASDLGLATTSPFYLMAAITEERLAALMTRDGQTQWESAIRAAERLAEGLNRVPGCKVVRSQFLGPGFSHDPCHVVVNTRATGLIGQEILSAMQQRFAEDLEMATIDTVIILVGPEHDSQYRTLLRHFSQVVGDLPRGKKRAVLSVPVMTPMTRMPPGQAWRAAPELVPVSEAIGRVSAQMIGAYPPGQAVLAPGELITEETIKFLLQAQRAGGRLKGISGDMAKARLWVACTGALRSNSD